MSIELRQAAQRALNALDEATTYTGSPSWSPSMTDECIAAASALRAALSQQPATAIACGIPGMAKTTCPYCEQGFAFEHEQPATPEPVLFIHPDTFAMNNAHVGAWKPGHELTGYIPLYTHPAPSVRGDVARDAERYRWLRSDDIEVLNGQREIYVVLGRLPFREDQTDEVLTEFELDAAIDAAMLAAK